MRLKKESSEQKLRGAYYTPLQLADAMVELFASQNISTVLEIILPSLIQRTGIIKKCAFAV